MKTLKRIPILVFLFWITLGPFYLIFLVFKNIILFFLGFWKCKNCEQTFWANKECKILRHPNEFDEKFCPTCYESIKKERNRRLVPRPPLRPVTEKRTIRNRGDTK